MIVDENNHFKWRDLSSNRKVAYLLTQRYTKHDVVNTAQSHLLAFIANHQHQSTNANLHYLGYWL